MNIMKKKGVVIATVAVTASTAIAFAACGKSEEERFNAAKASFENYTVSIAISFDNGNEYHSELAVDGDAGKAVVTLETSMDIYYFKKENGSVSRYLGKNSGWQKTNYSTIEAASASYNGVVSLFQAIYYDDFERDGDCLKMKDSALSACGKNLNYALTLSSVKIVLAGSEFISAIVVANTDDFRSEFRYTFRDYGKTSVTLPAV